MNLFYYALNHSNPLKVNYFLNLKSFNKIKGHLGTFKSVQNVCNQKCSKYIKQRKKIQNFIDLKKIIPELSLAKCKF